MFWRKKQFDIESFKSELLENLKEKLYNETVKRKTLDNIVDTSQELLIREVNQFCEDLNNSQAIVEMFEGTNYEKPSIYGIKKQAAGSLIDYLFVNTRINAEANRYVLYKYKEN